MTLGEMIKRYCEDHAMSMQDFADRSHLSKAYVGMLIKGINPSTKKPVEPTIKTYQQVADAMGMSITDVLRETQGDVPSRYVEITEPPKEDRYRKIADAIVDKLREEEDDEIWQLREDMRRNPALRALWDFSRQASPKEISQLNAIIRAIRGENNEDN